jgi:hypothetical protein
MEVLATEEELIPKSRKTVFKDMSNPLQGFQPSINILNKKPDKLEKE